MNRITRLIAVIVLCFSAVAVLKSWAGSQGQCVNDGKRNISVEINYGGMRPSRTVEARWAKDRTVLEVLQTVAKVETHPVGQYVFVTSIDGVKGRRGKMGWYYTIDGKSADKLAYSSTLDNNMQHIKWIYKKDICSGKVDGGI